MSGHCEECLSVAWRDGHKDDCSHAKPKPGNWVRLDAPSESRASKDRP